MMAAALIGITTDRYFAALDLTQQGITQAYIEAVYQAGGCPVLIPLGGPWKLMPELARRLDGLLFTGGGDVHPAAYASQPHPKVTYVDEDRDRVEIALLHLAIERRLPFLGICRGLQVINVALGGTLFEDITEQRPDSAETRLCSPVSPAQLPGTCASISRTAAGWSKSWDCNRCRSTACTTRRCAGWRRIDLRPHRLRWRGRGH